MLDKVDFLIWLFILYGILTVNYLHLRVRCFKKLF